MPKSYDEFKRNLKENLDEIKLTGSSKTFWENLAKLIGEKKATKNRLKYLEKKLDLDLQNIDSSILNPELCKANIENQIGSVQIPLGIGNMTSIRLWNQKYLNFYRMCKKIYYTVNKHSTDV